MSNHSAPDTTEISPHSVLATSNLSDERTKILKQGDTFAVLDHCGFIQTGGLGEQGLYQEGTRFLSRLQLDLEGHPLFHLGSTVSSDDGQLAVALTNPDLMDEGHIRLPFGTIHLSVQTFLWKGVLYQRLRAKNYGTQTVDSSLSLRFEADYADIYEVRGKHRPVRGTDLTPHLQGNRLTLGYEGLDRVVRRTVIQLTPQPFRITASVALLDLVLAPHEETEFLLTVAMESSANRPEVLDLDVARLEARRNVEQYRAWSCHLRSSDSQINAWIDRAESDLQMMTTELPTGPYPYAGVPWFNTPFGRDGIITALETLWLRPSLARGVLSYLASTQAQASIAEEDAEPGKILHETRKGEMAALKEMPFGRYYGGVDTTPLFVILAGAYYERTADRQFIESIWSNVESALGWIDNFGDQDGDGFVEYGRRSADGLIHQGWKDSDDALFHADGSPVTGPIALCEVQAYVYAAKRAAAGLAAMLGRTQLSTDLEKQADILQEKFQSAFWSAQLSTYVVALDGKKHACRVRASNAGHCLFAGIASEEHANLVARSLLSPEMFSGWGVRTVASTEQRYNPMGYHTGAVWPHDNALIALGLSRYGFQEYALQILTGMFEAGLHFDLHRMPELFCGFTKEPGEGPILYPVACAPQAWSAASVFLLFQACLGMEISGVEKRVYFARPHLPSFINELRIHNLEVGNGSVDLLIAQAGQDVAVDVLRREGDIQVIVAK